MISLSHWGMFEIQDDWRDFWLAPCFRDELMGGLKKWAVKNHKAVESRQGVTPSIFDSVWLNNPLKA